MFGLQLTELLNSILPHPVIFLSESSIILRLIIGFVLNAILAVAALKKGSVTAGGTVSGVLLGTFLFLTAGGLLWFLMGAFFVSSSVFSKIRDTKWGTFHQIHSRGSKRDPVQVFANGSISMIFAGVYTLTGSLTFLFAAAGAFAAATADTWASELGPLSKVQPVSIIGGEKVKKGMSGGITPAGTAASLAGAVFISGITTGVLFLAGWNGLLYSIRLAGVIGFAGFAGSVIDSLLGATVQGLYLRKDTGSLTERSFSGDGNRRIPNRLVRGFRFINNDLVNFLSIGAASCIVWLLML